MELLDYRNGSGDDEQKNSSSISSYTGQDNATTSDVTMDSCSNLSTSDLINSMPVEKCSINNRKGRNPDVPKKQVLTGYIIYASEIRRQIIEKNPNQNFGFISRIVGNEWRALPQEIKAQYEHRAAIHNKRVKAMAQLESEQPSAASSNDISQTPKLSKRKLAQLTKERMRQHHLSNPNPPDDFSDLSISSVVHTQQVLGPSPSVAPPTPVSISSPAVSITPLVQPDQSITTNLTTSTLTNAASQVSSVPVRQKQHSKRATGSRRKSSVDCATQTSAIRFVDPPERKRLTYSDTFLKHLENIKYPKTRDLPATNNDTYKSKQLVAEEQQREPKLANWLGNGQGQHESPEAALWALRNFMLQDTVAMKWSLQPYH